MNNSTKQVREITLKLKELSLHYAAMALKGTYSIENVIIKLKSICYDVSTLDYETIAAKSYIRDTKEYIEALIVKFEVMLVKESMEDNR